MISRTSPRKKSSSTRRLEDCDMDPALPGVHARKRARPAGAYKKPLRGPAAGAKAQRRRLREAAEKTLVTTECNPRWTKSAGCPGNDPIDVVRFPWGEFYRGAGNTTLISKGFQFAWPNVGHSDKAKIASWLKRSSSRAACRYAEEITGRDLAPMIGRERRENSGAQELYQSVVA